MFYMQSVLIKLEKLKIDYVNLFAMQSNWEKFNEKRMSNQTIQKKTRPLWKSYLLDIAVQETMKQSIFIIALNIGI